MERDVTLGQSCAPDRVELMSLKGDIVWYVAFIASKGRPVNIEYAHERPPLEPPQPGSGPDPTPVTGARLRTLRDGLSISDAQAAQLLGISRRTLIRWEAAAEVPAAAAARMAALYTLTEEVSEHLAARGGQVAIYREGWRVIDQTEAMPESWWRAVVGSVEGLTVVWGEAP